MSDGVAPSKGAMRAAFKILERAYTFEGTGAECAEIIDRETKSPQMADLLRRIIEDLPTKRDWLDPDLEQAARRLLSELEVKP